jgi:hypothetical protein
MLLREMNNKEFIHKTETKRQTHHLNKEPVHPGIMLKIDPNLQEHPLHKEVNRKENILKTGQHHLVQMLHKIHNPEVIILHQEIHLPEIIILLKTVIEDLNCNRTSFKTRSQHRVFFYFFFD